MNNKTPIVEFPVETTSFDEMFPVGIPLPWGNANLPSARFVWVEGQEFDLAANPKLAAIYPSGFLPDPRWDFFRYVPRDQTPLHKSPQSVQPLTFLGVPMDPHGHASKYGEGNTGGGLQCRKYGSTQRNYTVSDMVNPISAGTPKGVIGGTGESTKPQSMDWYCIMRVR